MRNKPMRGEIRAGYIFSIMPDSIKSFLINKFNDPEIRKINSALKNIDMLTIQNRIKILQEFIFQLKQNKIRREREIENSLIVTLTVIAILILSSFIYAQTVLRSTNEIVKFIDSILKNGGMHIIIFPFLWGIVKSEYGVSPIKIVLTTKNPILDISISVVAALIISIMFIEQPSIKYYQPKVLWYFILITALTVGPAAEEIFFRYFLFYRSGGKYGYLLCGVVSSLLFAAVHIPESFLLFTKYLITGGLLCGICYIRKNLFAPFTAHSIANLILMLS